MTAEELRTLLLQFCKDVDDMCQRLIWTRRSLAAALEGEWPGAQMCQACGRAIEPSCACLPRGSTPPSPAITDGSTPRAEERPAPAVALSGGPKREAPPAARVGYEAGENPAPPITTPASPAVACACGGTGLIEQPGSGHGVPCPDCAPTAARSKSEYKRLKAQGVRVAPPAAAPSDIYHRAATVAWDVYNAKKGDPDYQGCIMDEVARQVVNCVRAQPAPAAVDSREEYKAATAALLEFTVALDQYVVTLRNKDPQMSERYNAREKVLSLFQAAWAVARRR